jgi:ATP-dependent exoDNAse (exonuclease V) beta subunit
LHQYIENVAPDADLERGLRQRAALLYVACTRARENLLVTGRKPASDSLELEVIQKQLARLPTRWELAGTALGIIFASAALVTLWAEAFWHL